MSQFPSPPVAGNAAVNGQEALTPEAIETVLADFRSWLQQLAAQPPSQDTASAEATESIDLHTLLGQLVAVRQEVNLQTKAARAQQEQNAEALRQLEQSLETLQQAQAGAEEADEQAQEELLRPLLKTLVDSYDALALASREVLRVQDNALPLLGQVTGAGESGASSAPAPRGFWARWFGGGPTEPSAQEAEQVARQERQRQTVQAIEQIRRLLDSVVTGYSMSLRRMERALQQYELEAIPCVGQPFDPELMEVVEVVADPGRSRSEVVEEVRRGYLWRGRLFRYAQVRVAKP
jgi:molecular chaperone GrpE